MAKKDISQTTEALIINSRSAKQVERERAQEALRLAKAQNRPVIFLKKGQGECKNFK